MHVFVPEDTTEHCPPSDTFYLIKGPLVALLGPDFLSKYAKGLSAILVGSHIDRGIALCFLPTGKLILSLDKDSYETLGLSAAKAKYPTKGEGRWTVNLDLTAKSFVPGRNLYDRVVSCLEERFGDVELLVFSETNDTTKRIEFPDEITAKEYTLQTLSEVWEDLSIPRLSAETTIDDEFLTEMNNWIGALHNNITDYLIPNKAQDLFASSFLPVLETETGTGTSFTWKGIIPPSFVLKQLNFLRQQVDSGALPWASLTVWGFEDTPISWRECQHFHSISGENDYSFLILPGDNYVMSLTVGPEDEFS
eukprot:TRINITY_DN9850_c0_g1_i1.p1 TRINITY_DN9850_c0_g1~~TRINITY_DN9850_c0_g1_i1.p1  ORF type:complete len:349 (+),score=44.12 TRINITY_DN9850_c0_g1_i1:125-1048(+)